MNTLQNSYRKNKNNQKNGDFRENSRYEPKSRNLSYEEVKRKMHLQKLSQSGGEKNIKLKYELLWEPDLKKTNKKIRRCVLS